MIHHALRLVVVLGSIAVLPSCADKQSPPGEPTANPLTLRPDGSATVALSGNPLTSTDQRNLQELFANATAISDTSSLLLAAGRGDQKLAIPADAVDKLRRNGSPLFVGGPDATLQLGAGSPYIDLPNLQKQVSELKNQVEQLEQEKETTQAFLGLSAPQVRAMREALGVTSTDKWLDRLGGVVVGGLLIAFLDRIRRR